MIIKEDRDNEYSANQHLATAESGLHIFVKTKGKRKSIAGPFKSKEEAEAHPARKFGDGVCKKEMCEGTMELEEAKLLKESSIKESHLFESEFAQLNEILGYLPHSNDHIATNGTHYFVGTKKTEDGKYDHNQNAVFHNIEDAKKFIDSGKKGTYKTIAGKTVTEAKKENYHSVFSKGKNEDKWCHHMDCDTKEDAHDEVRSIKDQGDHAKHLVVPKEDAKWHKMDGDSIHNYVKSHDKKSVSESFVNSLINGDKITAGNYFRDILKTNISTLLDSRKVEIAKTMFHGKTK